MLELKPRIDFGGQPWPIVVSAFDLSWLKSQLVPAQRQRLDKVTALVTDGTKRIEAERKHATDGPGHDILASIGQRLPNGNIVRSGEEQRLQRDIRSHAARQVVDRIIQIRQSLDQTVPPILRDMQRASLTAATLQERVFDKFSCLWRASAGMNLQDTAALKADYAEILEKAEPMELTKIAQRAIDDGSAQSLVLVDCLLRENFRRPRSERNFLNAALLNLVNVPEFNEAGPLLQEVVDLNNQALTAWAEFNGQANRATTLRIGQGLGRMSLAPTITEPQEEY